MATTVITIRPFNTYPREAHHTFSLEWVIRALISGEFKPDNKMFTELPQFTPTLPSKPHWFKRLYQNALARFTLSVRVSEEVAAKLKSIIGWHDKLRRYMDTIAKNFLEPIDYWDIYEKARIDFDEDCSYYFFERFQEELAKKPNVQLARKKQPLLYMDAYETIRSMFDDVFYLDELNGIKEHCLEIKNDLPEKGSFMGTMLIVAARVARETVQHFYKRS